MPSSTSSLDSIERSARLSLAERSVSALWAAVGVDDTAAARKLLLAGADPDEPQKLNGRSLSLAHWCVCQGAIGCLRLLAEVGANLEARTSSGLTPLAWAAGMGDEALVKELLSLGVRASGQGLARPAIHEAVRGFDRGPGVLGMLLDAGASLDERDARGQAPLHLAAREDWKLAARALLERGADILAPDASGELAADCAAAWPELAAELRARAEREGMDREIGRGLGRRAPGL